MAIRPKKKRREAGWLRRNEMARVFDVSVSAFDRHIKPLVPKDAIRGEGLSRAYYCRGCIEAWANHPTSPPVASGGSESDPLLVGGPSPALEDYRRQKAELAKLDLAERRDDLVNLAEFRDVHQRAARVLRKTGEQLQRQCGHDAWQIFDEGLVAAAKEIDGYFDSRES